MNGHKGSAFAFTSQGGYTLGFSHRIAHNGVHAETGDVMADLYSPSGMNCQISIEGRSVVRARKRTEKEKENNDSVEENE